MKIVVGLCGHSGVGKSTAVKYLVNQVNACGVYLGAAVLEEVRRLSLEETRDNERLVRVSLRENNRAELVLRGIPLIKEALCSANIAVVDAILLPEELDCLKSEFPAANLHLLKIHASLDVRVSRLEARAKRPLGQADIHARDQLEINNFRLGHVFNAATFSIPNNGTLNQFHCALSGFIQNFSKQDEVKN